MSEEYLFSMPGCIWAISRLVDGHQIALVQNRPLFADTDATAILRALRIPTTTKNLDLYFPERGSMGRCPTLELMELCNTLDPTNPHRKHSKEKKEEVGV